MFAYERLDSSMLPGKNHFFIWNRERRGDLDAIRRWCRDEFGAPGQGQVALWYSYLGAFWIRDEIDACAFRLRWC
jgi:hypothetical protein